MAATATANAVNASALAADRAAINAYMSQGDSEYTQSTQEASRRNLYPESAIDDQMSNTETACAQASALVYLADRPTYVKLGKVGSETMFRITHETHRLLCLQQCNRIGNTINFTIIAVRGTASIYDALTDISLLTATSSLSSLQSDLASIKEQISNYISNDDENVILTGHSYGGYLALSTLLNASPEIRIKMSKCITFNSFQFADTAWTQAQVDFTGADHATIKHICMRNDYSSMLLQTSNSPVGFVDVYDNDSAPLSVLPESWNLLQQNALHGLLNFTQTHPETGSPLTDAGPTDGSYINVKASLSYESALYTPRTAGKTKRTMYLSWTDGGLERGDGSIQLSDDSIDHDEQQFSYDCVLDFSVIDGCVATSDGQILIPRVLTSNRGYSHTTRMHKIAGTEFSYAIQVYQLGQGWKYAHYAGIDEVPATMPFKDDVNHMLGTDVWDVQAYDVNPLWHEGLRRTLTDFTVPPVGIGALTIGGAPKNIMVYQSIDNDYHNQSIVYYFTCLQGASERLNTEAYMTNRGTPVAGWTNNGGAIAWNEAVFSIQKMSVNQYFDSATPYLETIYKIATIGPSLKDLGSILLNNHPALGASTFGPYPTSPDRYIGVVSGSGLIYQCHIYVYMEDANGNTMLHFLSGAGSNNFQTDPDFPNTEFNIDYTSSGFPRWYPITTNINNDPEALWTVEFEP